MPILHRIIMVFLVLAAASPALAAGPSLLFDPATVGRGVKKRVFDLPGGAPRLDTDALGVHGVWVNGQRLVNSKGLLQEAPLAGALLTEFH